MSATFSTGLPTILGIDGLGIDNASVFIGAPGQDPQNAPVTVYWDESAAIPALQPIPTIGGYLSRAGTPSNVYTPDTYSLRVMDRFGALVFYQANVSASLSGGQRSNPVTLTGNTTITNAGLWEPNAIATIPDGVTLTIAGYFDAGRYQVFNCIGTGKVVFDRSGTTTCYPEWWGAVTNSPTSDCLAALTAAHDSMLHIDFAIADYYVSSTVRFWRNYTSGWGRGKFAYTPGIGTRICLMANAAGASTIPVVVFGSTTTPAGGPDAFMLGADFRGITAVRMAAPDPTFSTHPEVRHPHLYGPTAFRIQAVTRCYFADLYCGGNSNVGFCLTAVVYTLFESCSALRTHAATGSTDFWIGWALDGQVYDPALNPYAGGNASLYMNYCSATREFGGAITTNECSAVYTAGGCTDTYINFFEAAGGFTVAVYIEGTAVTFPSLVGRDTDVHIVRLTADGNVQKGIAVTELSAYGSVTVVDPYLGAAIGSLACVHQYNSRGKLTVIGGEMLCTQDADNGGNCIGYLVENATGINVSQTKIFGSRRPVVLQSPSSTGPTTGQFVIDVDVINPAEAGQAAPGVPGPAIYVDHVDRGRITASTDSGVAGGAFTAGVLLTSSAGHVTIEATNINPGSIIGGANNKVVYNGAQVTAVGAMGGGGYVFGVMT